LVYKNIPLAETHLYSKLVLDYVHQKEELKPFYQYTPTMSSFDEVIANSDFNQEKRTVLVGSLLQQYDEIGIDKKHAKSVFANIESLKETNTFTVTTGHQLALCTGPLFFIYKILSTIRLAEELNLKYPTKHFVPIFWMASEDHDFAEINHVFINKKKIEWDLNSNNQPVGVLSTNTVKDALDKLKAELGESNALIELFEKAYSESDTLSQATRKIVHALFADDGLVIVEPNTPLLKKELTQVMLDDVLKNSSFNALIDTNGKLGKNYKLQITGREINFFYLNAEGRNLIKKTKMGFEVNNTSLVFSETEIEAEIRNYPERFSPNVVLRPVYQETILPNLAYIGGPGEIAYWLQLKGVFATHSIPFPMIVLRNSMLLLPKSILHKLDKRSITIEQLFIAENELVKQFIQAEHPLIIDEEAILIEQTIQAAIDKLMPFDNKIAAQLIGWKLAATQQLITLKKEIVKSKKEKSEADIQLLLAIKHQLFPNNEPQERHDTLVQYTGNYYKESIALLKKQILPLSHTMDVVFWD
jgi:bacillithiol biosynthesis cysteine-adding enzyme BshC